MSPCGRAVGGASIGLDASVVFITRNEGDDRAQMDESEVLSDGMLYDDLSEACNSECLSIVNVIVGPGQQIWYGLRKRNVGLRHIASTSTLMY